MRPTVSTIRSHLTSAEICRQNGWAPGTVLIGDWLPKESIEQPRIRIRITALGVSEVLAQQLWPPSGEESLWDLHCREWMEERP